MIKAAIIIAALIQSAGTLDAQTVTCSTSSQGYRVCQGPHGWRSFETQRQGMTIGDDNRGDRWSTSQWQDREITTVTPRQER